MARSARPSSSQLREILRLIGDVRALQGDPLAQRRLLVDGACRLLDADQGFVSHFHHWRVGQKPRGISTIPGTSFDPRVAQFIETHYEHHGPQADAMGAALLDYAGQQPTVGALAWSDVEQHYRNASFDTFFDLVHTARFADILDPCVTDAAGQLVAISLHRLGRRTRPFTTRQKQLARLLADELHWLHTTGRLDADALLDRPRLPRRMQPVYQLLLTGVSGKEIASRTGLSVHTVRDYTKELYRLLGVNSRAELMTRSQRRPAER